VYNIVCDSIGVQPRPNNGTLRLPLKPVGLHSDQPNSADDTPIDFPPDKTSSEAPNVSDTSETSQENNLASNEMTVVEENEVTGEPEETKVEMNKFWAYVKAKMASAQEWAKKVLASLKGNHKDAEHQNDSFQQGNTST